MKNKLYQVQGVHSDYCNIVSAPNAKEAKMIGSNTEFTEDVDFIDLRVKVIKGGSSWWQEEPEIRFTIKGKGIIYTNIKSGLLDWKEFIAEFEKQKGIVIDTGMTFNEFPWNDEDDYFGVPRQEYDNIVNSPDLEHDINDFDDFCEVYGVDVSKITYKQVEQLLEGNLTLTELKMIQNQGVRK